ncbi:hypothetical protein FACS1894152_0150 [Bacilli bacterium]|nr:hypothetical protein FACS1894152_0150 [Bacilli bacterium]
MGAGDDAGVNECECVGDDEDEREGDGEEDECSIYCSSFLHCPSYTTFPSASVNTPSPSLPPSIQSPTYSDPSE